MISFPEWSDLGMGSLSENTRFTWEQQLVLLENYRYYFDGDVFRERVETDDKQDDAPFLFPLGVNLVKMLSLSLADALFGEWDAMPIQFAVQNDDDVTEADKQAIELINKIMLSSNCASMLWEHEVERNVFGAGAIKVAPALAAAGHVRWSRIPRQNFFPIPDPEDPNDLLEAYVVVPMTAEQAKAKYKYEASTELVNYVEHWTKFKYQTFLDNQELRPYTGVNAWGVVPFIYTPRIRATNWWGDSLAKDIIPVQDELNMRLADIGEAVNYNAHPTRWGFNLPRDFNAKNYPLGPNSFWNIGRTIGNSPEPKVGILEAQHAVSPEAFEFVKFVYDWARTSVFAPPIAFGEDEGGSQRSGATLEIRMWPLIKATRRSRAYLSDGLRRALYITGRILEQKRISDVPVRAVDSILKGRITPYYHPIMPRDQAAIVDEVVKLLSTQPQSISLETAQKILGRGTGEVERIKEMAQDEDLWVREDKAEEAKQEAQRQQVKEKPVDKGRLPD